MLANSSYVVMIAKEEFSELDKIAVRLLIDHVLYFPAKSYDLLQFYAKQCDSTQR